VTPLSLVIVAPEGVSRCLPFAHLAEQDNRENVEVVVADASSEELPADGIPNVRHLRMPGASVFALRRAAIAAASHEWVVVTEDHCRLMPGFFAAYRDAIREHPAEDLFSGSVINASKPTVASMANYFFDYFEHWAGGKARPNRPAISNLIVRKRVLRNADLALDGGFEFVALPRLAASGRYAQCPGAIVDHVQNGSLLEDCLGHLRNGKCTLACRHGLHGERIGTMARHLAHHCVVVAILRPLAIIRSLRGAYSRTWAVAPSLFLLGFSHALGAIAGFLSDPRGNDRKAG